MAVLSATELTAVRQACARSFTTIVYTKPQINAALQAIEDAMVTQTIPAGAVGGTIPQYLSSRIDTATSPLVFTAVQKRVLFALWAELKFQRDK